MTLHRAPRSEDYRGQQAPSESRGTLAVSYLSSLHGAKKAELSPNIFGTRLGLNFAGIARKTDCSFGTGRYTHRNPRPPVAPHEASPRETSFSAQEPGQSGDQRGEEHRSPQRECRRRHPYPESPFVER